MSITQKQVKTSTVVKVKPLEWEEKYGYRIIKSSAKSVLGDYKIDVTHQACENREDIAVETACFILAGKNLDRTFYHGKFEGVTAYEDAKAAVQADYESRILSALELSLT